MKQILLLALAAVSVVTPSFAGACGGGTLTSYVGLGAAGCTIGSDTLSNFQILSPLDGLTELGGGSVTINPSGTTFAPGITISISQSATAYNGIETMFTYDISGPVSFTGISTVLSGASATTPSDGVTGLVNFCEGGSFGSDGVDGCTAGSSKTGSLLTLKNDPADAAFDQLSDMSTVSNVPFLNVTDDFQLLSGGGTASGGTVTNSFTAVPEPMSTALVGFGLALVGALKVRSMRAK